jgi:hypothetical protein
LERSAENAAKRQEYAEGALLLSGEKLSPLIIIKEEAV